MFRYSMKNVSMVVIIFIFLFSANLCFSYEFQIVNHFENPLAGGVGDLTYNDDGYLYATQLSPPLYEYGNQIYKINPSEGTYVDFFEHPSEEIYSLSEITSYNGNLFVYHFPYGYAPEVIYKINPNDNTWTDFFMPQEYLSGGIACDGLNLILAERDYIYTVSLSTQVETSRNKLITADNFRGMAWDGEYVWAISDKEELNKIDLNNGSILEIIELPSTMDECRGLTYDGECFWTYVGAWFGIYAGDIVQFKLISSTTTTISEDCSAEEIYGEQSEETALLRYCRDNVLRKTPEGLEIIRLYYKWSPAIVKAMEKDEEFREELKEMIDGVLELVGGETE